MVIGFGGCWEMLGAGGKGDNFGFGGLDIGACLVKVLAFAHMYGLRWVAVSLS